MAKLPKKPKQPKKSASLNTWKNYEERMKDWERKVKDKLKPAIEKEKIRRKMSGKTISSLKR